MIELHTGRQTYDFDCGTKALQMVLAYYGVETREDALMEELGTGEHGTSVDAMIAVSKRYGFSVRAGTGWTLGLMKRFVDDMHPVIVLLQAWADKHMTLDQWRSDFSDGHYAVVIDHARGVLLFEDPATFRRTWLRESEFLARWHDRDDRTGTIYNRFAMVLLGKPPAGKSPQHMD